MSLFGSSKLLRALLGSSCALLGPIRCQNGPQNGAQKCSKRGPKRAPKNDLKNDPKSADFGSHFGGSWGGPGGVYLVDPRGFWALLGLLGLSWPLLASLGALLGLSWGSLGAFLALLASFWGSLGLSWGSLGALLGSLGAPLGSLGQSWFCLGLSQGFQASSATLTSRFPKLPGIQASPTCLRSSTCVFVSIVVGSCLVDSFRDPPFG